MPQQQVYHAAAATPTGAAAAGGGGHRHHHDIVQYLADNLAVTAQPALHKPRQSRGPSSTGDAPQASSGSSGAARGGSAVPGAAQLPHNKHATIVTEQQRWLQQLPASVRDQAANYLRQHASLLNPRPATAGAALPGQPPNINQLAMQATMLAATSGGRDFRDVSSHLLAAAYSKPGRAASVVNMPTAPAAPNSRTGAQQPLPPRHAGATWPAQQQQQQQRRPDGMSPPHAAATHQARPQAAPRALPHGPKQAAGSGGEQPAVKQQQQQQQVGLPGSQPRAGALRAGVGGPGRGGGVMPLTADALRQLPVGKRPAIYQPVPSDLASHAYWWQEQPGSPGSCASFPRTAVTDQESVTPSEMAVWNTKMQELEATLLAEKQRRQEFEEQLRQLQTLASSRGQAAHGGGGAGAAGAPAGRVMARAGHA